MLTGTKRSKVKLGNLSVEGLNQLKNRFRTIFNLSRLFFTAFQGLELLEHLVRRFIPLVLNNSVQFSPRVGFIAPDLIFDHEPRDAHIPIEGDVKEWLEKELLGN